MDDAESYETIVESGSFHSGLSNEIDTDGDSEVSDSDSDILPQFSVHADAVVEAYQCEPTQADKDKHNVDH